ncbi:MAG: DNA translocase FtsK 4TM domain-containing protein [Rhodospirillales bacterium]
MARTASPASGDALLPAALVAFMKRRAFEAAGGLLIAAGAGLMALLLTYSPSDPSLNSASGHAPANLLGTPGALLADIFLQTIGVVAALPALTFWTWGVRLLRKESIASPALRVMALLIAMALACGALAALAVPGNWPLACGMGGFVGDMIYGYVHQVGVLVHADAGPAAGAALFAGISASLMVYAFGWSWRDWVLAGGAVQRASNEAVSGVKRVGGGLQSVAGTLDSVRTRFAERRIDETSVSGALDADDDASFVREPAAVKSEKPRKKTVVSAPAPKTRAGRKAERERQKTLDLGEDGVYSHPPLALLEENEPSVPGRKVSSDSLEENARFLSSVLEDFGVRGEIVKVRPGPVVTLYELEPAPGTKTSRVIGLSDDIARSMSAISVRVAVVPGRSVIGIELPNSDREMVGLRELLASEAFEKASAKLPLALGKDIGGQPVIVDLARMPHLLIAGTTGSGKSVGMNAMILSLLYRTSPDECKFIMIDPKMLELSVYDDIPHLLTPVVTDPSKAVVALKWTVREMEDRYRAMSQLGVRNIAGFNQRIVEAQKKGETLTRRVQTGFDADGQPVYEDQAIANAPLPYIVVVVDEMADLMLVAGKDVEAAIQRLAQMARAAGIHLIMATQRPSVDVITGTIKANFPTRISFQVTSKIDSRTILGEQGAENLLGQGDMLYMAGGGRITRTHGPFVSDEEVESVVEFLKGQGDPSYIEEVTRDDDPGSAGPGSSGSGGGSDELYDEAVALVAREGKASTSFIQRHLQIGYNRAARIIEQMEKEGVVSAANRVGKREVLVGSH